MLYFNKNGQFNISFFSSKIEDAFRVISMDIQHRDVDTWGTIVSRYNMPGVVFHLTSLDVEKTFTDSVIPVSMITSALSIPRVPFTFCTDPVDVFLSDGHRLEIANGNGIEMGIPSEQVVIFRRIGASYFLGRTFYVPDDNNIAHHLLLICESDNFYGHGLFFNVEMFVMIFLTGLGLAVVFWFPFIHHIVTPVLAMADYAEKMLESLRSSRLRRLDARITRRKDELGRLGRSLDFLIRQLKQQLTGQEQFIHHIAHEINSPLARCRIGLKLLEETSGGRQKEQLINVEKDLSRLAALTEEVLDFLRAQSSPAVVTRQPVELAPVIADLLNSNLPETDVQVEMPERLVIWADRACLKRAVSNVLRNAVLYAGDAGPILFRAGRDASGAYICVRDFGPGADEKELPFLSEPFYRGAGIQLKYPGGSGLGLSIVRNSVEQCGGTVIFSNAHPGFMVCMKFPPEQKGS